jgi:hypothetical protein
MGKRKGRMTAFFDEQWEATIVEPGSPLCDVIPLENVRNDPTIPGIKGTALYHYDWRVDHVSGRWRGEATKEENRSIRFDLEGWVDSIWKVGIWQDEL